jgi:hypothetical protein
MNIVIQLKYNWITIEIQLKSAYGLLIIGLFCSPSCLLVRNIHPHMWIGKDTQPIFESDYKNNYGATHTILKYDFYSQ